MSYLFFGDPEKPKRRTKYAFHSIEKSVFMEQLNSLPDFPAPSSLRQDAVFAAVAPEFKQVKDDVIAVYSKMDDELQTEKLQTQEINEKISDSIRKLESSLSKLARLRSKQKKSFLKQHEKFESAYSDLDKRLRDVKNINTEIVETLVDRQTALVDEKEFPLIAKILNHKLKKNSFVGSLSNSGTRGSSSSSLNSSEDSDESASASALPRSNIPGQLTISSIRGASAPSVSLTLQNINITEPFFKNNLSAKDVNLLN